MAASNRRFAFLCLALVIAPSAVGCAPLLLGGQGAALTEGGNSPLEAPAMPADSVALEICTVRGPADDPQLNSELWKEVDEQQLPADLRARLAQNGFRAGRVAGRVPPVIQKLLDAHRPQILRGGVTLTSVDQPAAFESERRHARAGRTGEILVSERADRWSVLYRDAQGSVTGGNLLSPQAVFRVTTYPRGDGQAQLDLLPEIQHGEARMQPAATGGIMTLLPGRPTRAFDELQLQAVLAAGDVLVIGKLPDSPGTLGHHFFSSGRRGEEQKLILVRLAQTQYDDLFRAPPAAALASGESAAPGSAP